MDFTNLSDLTVALMAELDVLAQQLRCGYLWELLSAHVVREHQREWWRERFILWATYDSPLDYHPELMRHPLEFLNFLEEHYLESPPEATPEETLDEFLFYLDQEYQRF